MIMTPSQGKNFMKLLNKLTVFVNDKLGLMRDFMLFSGPSGAIGSQAQNEVMQALWENTGLIQEYLDVDPDRLSNRDRKTVALWTKGLADYFTAVRLRDGRLMLMSDGYLFDVRGISREIDTMIPETPCIVQTMVVPNDGIVTYTSSLAVMSVSIGPTMREHIEEEVEEALQDGRVVSSEKAFLAAVEEIRRKREEHALEDAVHEAENILGAADPVAGCHRGALAGMAEEERAAAIEAYERALEEEDDDLFAWDDPYRRLKFAARAGSPKFAAAELFAKLSKDDLEGICADLVVPGVEGMKKAELAQALAAALRDDPEILQDAASALPTRLIDLVREVAEAGGSLYVPDARVREQEETLLPRPPLLFLYHTKGTFIYVVPAELVDAVRALDWDEIRRVFERRDGVRKLAGAATELRGIVPVYEFLQECRDVYPEFQDDEQALTALMEATGSQGAPLFSFMLADDGSFLLHGSLARDYYSAHDDVDLVYGLKIIGGQLDGRLNALLDEQGSKEPRPVFPDILTHSFSMLWRPTVPAARALRNWLDENVPDGKDDFTFADDLMMDFVAKAREGGVGADVLREYLEMLERAGLMMDEAHLQPFLNLLMEFVNTQPIWPNNGWSPAELAELH